MSLKTLILKTMVFLWIPNLLTNVVNLFFSRKRLNTFPWWYAIVIIPFLFVWRISSYSLMISAASSGFCTFSAFSFSSTVSIVSLLTGNLSAAVLLLLHWVASSSSHFQSLSTKNKNNQYTINLKHLLQTKTRLCWAQNTSFSTWLRVIKVLLPQASYHKHFFKTIFQINLISKKKS